MKTRGLNVALLPVLIMVSLIVPLLLVQVAMGSSNTMVGPEVDISPTRIGAGPGENIPFVVYVTNAGNVADNYNLILADKLGWGSTLSATSIIVAAGATKADNLMVTIPENAQPYAEDNITITVVSQTDNTLTASKSCIAQAMIASNYPSYVLGVTFVLTSTGIALALYLLIYLRRH